MYTRPCPDGGREARSKAREEFQLRDVLSRPRKEARPRRAHRRRRWGGTTRAWASGSYLRPPGRDGSKPSRKLGAQDWAAANAIGFGVHSLSCTWATRAGQSYVAPLGLGLLICEAGLQKPFLTQGIKQTVTRKDVH